MYEKYSTRGVSRGKYSTRLRLLLYLPLDTHPRAVFPVHTRGSALTIPYWILRGRIKGQKCTLFSI